MARMPNRGSSIVMNASASRFPATLSPLDSNCLLRSSTVYNISRLIDYAADMYACEYLLKTRTISADIANRVEPLGVSKGKQDLYLRTRPETLEVLRETDISQSTVASNALEGVTVSPERLDALL